MDEQIQEAYNTLNTHKKIPELFCKLIQAIQTLPSATYSQEAQDQVNQVYIDVNTKVEEYNRQFQILLNELGVLCRRTNQNSKFQEFFTSFLDLLRMAYTVYNEDEAKLEQFQPVLQKLLVLLKTNQIHLEQENTFQNALLLQLVNSAWALTNTRGESLEQAARAAKQQGGRKTRKQRR